MADRSVQHYRRAKRFLLLQVCAVMVVAGALGAQCPDDSGRADRGTPFRVRWNVGNLLVTPDTSRGVSLWFVTNQRAQVDGHGVERQFNDRFEPDSLLSWLIFTRQLLELKAPIPNDTSTVVTSGYLHGLDGGIVVAARIRKKNKLSDKVRVLMSPKQDTAFMIELDPSSVDTLIKAAAIAADRSGYRRVPVAADFESLPGHVAVQPIPTNRSPSYPSNLQQRGIEGEVWARFCVAVDGRPDLDTFWSAMSDDEAFEQSVRAYLRQAHYKPATVDGTPIRQLVFQRFVFALSR